MQVLPGGLRPTHGHAGGESDRIHCAGAGGADRLYSEPTILEQMVDHAPDKGTMRAAALEREIHVFQGIAHFWNFARTILSVSPDDIASSEDLCRDFSRNGHRGMQPMALFEEKERHNGNSRRAREPDAFRM